MELTDNTPNQKPIREIKREHAIEFAQWIRINRFKPLMIDLWISPYYKGMP